MATATLTYPRFKAWDNDNNFLSGGKVYTYLAGTSTPKTTYSDTNLTTPHTNPVILDANGEAEIYFDAALKVILKDANDITLWTQDEVTGNLAEAVLITATDVSYDNTTSGLTAINVQTATDEIEGRVDTLEANAFSGNAVDVTYDNTTTGMVATNVQTAIDEVHAGLGGGSGGGEHELYDITATKTLVADDNTKTIIVWQDAGVRNIELPEISTVVDRYYVTVINGLNPASITLAHSHGWVYVVPAWIGGGYDDIVWPNSGGTAATSIKLAMIGDKVTLVSDRPNGRWVVVEDTREAFVMVEGFNQSIPNNTWTRWDLFSPGVDPHVLADLSANEVDVPIWANWCEVSMDISLPHTASTQHNCRVVVDGTNINGNPSGFASTGTGWAYEEFPAAGTIFHSRFRLRTGPFQVKPLSAVAVELHQNSGSAQSLYGDTEDSPNRAVFHFWR